MSRAVSTTDGSSRHRVVVVGGGFGGLEAVRRLRSAPVDVTLIDRRSFDLFQPLAYQVATGVLSPDEIAAPLRRIVRRERNVRVVLGTTARAILERLGGTAAPPPFRYRDKGDLA